MKKRTHVQISKSPKGTPSVKVDGHEINMLIGKHVILEHVDDGDLGHWVLRIDLIEPEVDVEVEAELSDLLQPLGEQFKTLAAERERLRNLRAEIKEINEAAAAGSERATK